MKLSVIMDSIRTSVTRREILKSIQEVYGLKSKSSQNVKGILRSNPITEGNLPDETIGNLYEYLHGTPFNESNELDVSKMDNMKNIITEALAKVKRKWTDDYPAIHINPGAILRNKLVKFIGDGDHNRVTRADFDTYCAALQEDEEVGKSPSRSWLSKNMHLIEKVKVGKTPYLRLSGTGKRVYSYLLKEAEEAEQRRHEESELKDFHAAADSADVSDITPIMNYDGDDLFTFTTANGVDVEVRHDKETGAVMIDTTHDDGEIDIDGFQKFLNDSINEVKYSDIEDGNTIKDTAGQEFEVLSVDDEGIVMKDTDGNKLLLRKDDIIAHLEEMNEGVIDLNQPVKWKRKEGHKSTDRKGGISFHPPIFNDSDAPPAAQDYPAGTAPAAGGASEELNELSGEERFDRVAYFESEEEEGYKVDPALVDAELNKHFGMGEHTFSFTIDHLTLNVETSNIADAPESMELPDGTILNKLSQEEGNITYSLKTPDAQAMDENKVDVAHMGVANKETSIITFPNFGQMNQAIEKIDKKLTGKMGTKKYSQVGSKPAIKFQNVASFTQAMDLLKK